MGMNPHNLKEWERRLVDARPGSRAVLYRDKATGRIGWAWAYLWARLETSNREVIKRTTAQEAHNFKWLAHEEKDKT